MTPDTAASRLERILYILPAAARDRGAAISELAAALDVDPATVLRDLEQATARAFYHPAGAVESFSIMIDGHTVSVHAPTEFQRPVRLNQREALALGLGLRTLAADAEPARRSEILAFAKRLEAELSTTALRDVREIGAAPMSMMERDRTDRVPQAYVDGGAGDDVEENVEFEDYALAFDDDGFRGVVADAIQLGRVCTIWYLKPGDVAPSYRSIAPYRLLYADGTWYVAAYDLDREALRFFRMDRVLNAILEHEDTPAIPAVELDAFLRNGAPYMADDDIEVHVRYSPRVARWVMERTAGHAEEDGSILLHHRVADPRWIVRHVMQYGGDAVVEGPELARAWVAVAAGEAAASDAAASEAGE